MTIGTADPRASGNDEPEGGPEGWVDRHGDCLYRYALLRLRSPDLAADAVQETFLDALRGRAAFAGRSTERTWLVGILRHKILDQFRKAGRAASRAEPPGRAGEAGPGAVDDFDRRGGWAIAPAAWRGEPSRDLESREFWDAFGSCLAKLPKGVADAFFLREIDDLDADEVRAILGITPANLWTRLHRARSLLRGCLESNWFADRPRAGSPPASKGQGPP